MTKAEKSFFITHFARSYFRHFQENHASFLARIYGVYTVKMAGHDEVHLMMMANTLQIKNSDRIERIYDLKGSYVKREVIINKKTSCTKTLKDINFLKLKKREPIKLIEID